MTKIFKKISNSSVFLSLILVLHSVANIFFLKSHTLVDGKDSLAHMASFVNFLHRLEFGAQDPFNITGRGLFSSFMFVSADYPPFFYWIAGLLKLVFGGISSVAPLFASTVFLIVLLVCVYKIGKKISNVQLGLLGCAILSSYPIIFSSSRHFNLEIATCAMTAISVLCLLHTELFSKRGASIILGVVIGLGMLTRQLFLIYFIGPFIVSAIFGLKPATVEERKQIATNISLTFGIVLILSSVFYLRPEVLNSILSRSQFRGAVSHGNILSSTHLTYYLSSLTQTIGIFFVILLTCSLLLINKINKYSRAILLSWVLVPVSMLLMFKIKYAEYLMPVFAAFALFSAHAIINITNSTVRRAVACLVLGIGALFCYGITFDDHPFFYSRYHLDDVYRYEAGHDDGGNTVFMGEVLERIGNSRAIVAIVYDDAGVLFNSYFLRRIFSLTENKSIFIDFFLSPGVFFHNLDSYDQIIFISTAGNNWLSKITFNGLLGELNNRGFYEYKISSKNSAREVETRGRLIVIPGAGAEKILGLIDDYKLKYTLRFDNQSRGLTETISIYNKVH